MSGSLEHAHILIVEDEAVFAKAVCRHFRNNGFDCAQAGALGEARHRLQQSLPDLVLLDMRLPDGSGLDFLEWLRDSDACDVPVIAMTAFGALEDAVSAMKLGALDYLKKPVDLDELLLCVTRALENAALKRGLDYSRLREDHAAAQVQLVGDGAAMQELRQQVRRIGSLVGASPDAAPTVLMLGETGSGKDLVARMLHRESRRRELPFVHVDCASLPGELIEAELFGHARGAFTGAASARTGLIEAAENGTLFMDEVAELPLQLQGKLLAALERRMFRRLGSSRERPVNAWILAATNRPLAELVAQGRFRADLYYRLQVLNIRLPPLRQRAEDIPALAHYFAEQTARRFGLPRPRIAADALDRLTRYPWPGNVRELRNEIERAVLLGRGNALGVRAFRLAGEAAQQDPPAAAARAGGRSLADAEQEMIRDTLTQTMGNVSQAAARLGITRMTLRYRMQKYGIQAKA